MEILKETEGFAYYKEAVHAFEILDKIYNKAKKDCLTIAKYWAELNKSEKVISVLAVSTIAIIDLEMPSVSKKSSCFIPSL